MIRNFNLKSFIALLLVLLLSRSGLDAQDKRNYLDFIAKEDIHDFFKYTENKSVIVSGHRGGRMLGYPENCIETFQYILDHYPAFFEIDPRLTKDSVIVLMHDATLDRTTTATGKLSDYTWEELQEVRLLDGYGNETAYKIPLLEEVIKWSKGKTVINLDKKDVPMEMIVALIKKHKAADHVMLTVHTGAQARYYHDRIPAIMMSVFSRNNQEYEDLVISGVPWRNMIAYVGKTIDNTNIKLVESLHANGVRCMISVAPTHDNLLSKEERRAAYLEEINKNPDIIESDIPLEIGEILTSLNRLRKP